MNCPACGTENTRVLKSMNSGLFIARRRQCPCGARWTTEERLIKGTLVATGGQEGSHPDQQPPPVASNPPPLAMDSQRGVGGGLSSDLIPDPSGSVSDPPLEVVSRSDRAREKQRYPLEFETIWKLTGLRGLKLKAFKAWKLVGSPTWDAIRAAWTAYMASERPAAGFVQDLSTWLRARGHEQEWQPAKGYKPAPGDLRCDWHRDVRNDAKPSRFPRAECPRCKHFAARAAARASEPTPIAALMRPDLFDQRAADVERLRKEREEPRKETG